MTIHRWVSHESVPQYLLLGWLALPTLEGTGHGIYSAHCVWMCACEPAEPFRPAPVECDYPQCACPRYGRCRKIEAAEDEMMHLNLKSGHKMTDDRQIMGTPEAATASLIELCRKWRELRQPSMATAKQHKERDAIERETRFQIANAALLWLWHKENPAPELSNKLNYLALANQIENEGIIVCGVWHPENSLRTMIVEALRHYAST